MAFGIELGPADVYFLAILLLSIPYVIGFIVILLYSGKYDLSTFLGSADELPLVSVVLPTYNEAKRIRAKVENSLNLDYPHSKLEIVIVDCSTDDTPLLAKELSKTTQTISYIREPQRMGLAAALNLGYKASRGDIVIKSDADSLVLSKDAIRRAVRLLANPQVGAICGVRTGAQDVEGGLRSLQTMQQMAETMIDSTIVAHGSFVAFKKELIGPIDPTSTADDTELFLEIRKKGYRTMLDTGITTYEPYERDFSRRMKQQSRRAGGISRVLLANAGILDRQVGSRYAYIVYPLNLLMIVLLPWYLITVVTLISLEIWRVAGMAVFAFVSLAVVLAVASYLSMKPKFIAGLIDIALSCFLGQLNLFIRPPDFMWVKGNKS